MFRHKLGKNYLRAGFTLMDVSKMLGPQDVATTQIYLHGVENEDLRELVLQSSLGTMYTPDEFKTAKHKRIHVVSDEARKRMSEGGRKGGLQRLAVSG